MNRLDNHLRTGDDEADYVPPVEMSLDDHRLSDCINEPEVQRLLADGIKPCWCSMSNSIKWIRRGTQLERVVVTNAIQSSPKEERRQKLVQQFRGASKNLTSN